MSAATIVAAVGLRADRGGRTVLDGVDLEVGAGEVLAVVGPSGSGKSTLLALLAGLEQPDGGRVDLGVRPEEVGVVLQGYGLVNLLTAEENVAVPLQTGRDRLPPREVRRSAREALEQVGLDGVADHLVEALSGGQQQRVAVARALVARPRLLLADEATAALDARNRGRTLDLLLGLRRPDTAVVLATHDATVAGRADRVLALHEGRLVPRD